MKPSLVPEGWSNDPKKLHTISANFSSENFGLEDLDLYPLLASTTDDWDPRLLLCGSAKFYIWHNQSERIFYVTNPYELCGVLRRMSAVSPGSQFKELHRLPAERFTALSEYLKLSFDEVPKDWSNDVKSLKDLRQVVPAQEHGLSLPLPILSGASSLGLAFQVFQMGEQYYIYNQISLDIFRFISQGHCRISFEFWATLLWRPFKGWIWRPCSSFQNTGAQTESLMTMFLQDGPIELIPKSSITNGAVGMDSTFAQPHFSTQKVISTELQPIYSSLNLACAPRIIFGNLVLMQYTVSMG